MTLGQSMASEADALLKQFVLTSTHYIYIASGF